jgi:hypothetical protein
MVPGGVVYVPGGEDGVVLLQEFAGDVRGGDDHSGDRAHAQGHERTMDLGEVGERAVWLVAEEVEVSDEWQRAGTWREAAACVGEKVQEVDGEDGDDEPWQPGKKGRHFFFAIKTPALYIKALQYNPKKTEKYIPVLLDPDPEQRRRGRETWRTATAAGLHLSQRRLDEEQPYRGRGIALLILPNRTTEKLEPGKPPAERRRGRHRGRRRRRRAPP